MDSDPPDADDEDDLMSDMSSNGSFSSDDGLIPLDLDQPEDDVDDDDLMELDNLGSFNQTEPSGELHL